MITTLIVNYHGAAITARAAASVLADAPGGELIVVDNSADEAEAERLKALLPPGARLLVAPGNLGFGKGCNLGLEQAAGDYIFLLNPDAWVLPGCTAALAAALDADPRLGAVTPRAWLNGGRQLLIAPGKMESPWAEARLGLGLRHAAIGRLVSERFRAFSLRCWSATAPVAQEMLSGGFMMVRRRAAEASGGLFDPRFFMFYEDTDLSRRLRAHGWRLALIPTAEVVHEFRMEASKIPLMAGGRQAFFDKYHPPGRWRALCERLGGAAPAWQWPGLVDLGSPAEPFALPVPPAWRDGWLLEASPHPLFVPAAGMLGRGDTAHFPADAWANAAPLRYFARLAPALPRPAAAHYYSWLAA